MARSRRLCRLAAAALLLVAVDETTATFVELFYQARFVPWLSVQPDAQLDVSPAGTALTVAFRVRVEL